MKRDYRELRQLANVFHDRFSELNYDQSMSSGQKFNLLLEYFKTIASDWEDVLKYLEEFEAKFDENLYGTTMDILNKWLDDGVFNELFITTVFSDIVKRIETGDANLQSQINLKRDKSQKITSDELDTTQDSYLWDLNDFNERTRSILQGLSTGEINAVLGERNVKNINVDYATLTGDLFNGKVLYSKPTKNLFNKLDVIKDSYVRYTNGNVVTQANYCASVFIPVTAGLNYYIQGTTEQFAIYDGTGKFVRGLSGSGSSNMPIQIKTGEAYIRMSCLTSQLDSVMISNAENPQEYVPYNYIDGEYFMDSGISPSKDKWAMLPSLDNDLMANINTTIGKFVSSSNGSEITNSAYWCSDFIEIDSRLHYAIEGTTEQFALFDKNKKFLRGYAYARFLLTADLTNVRYIRVNGKTEQLNNVSLRARGLIDNSYFKEKAIEPTTLRQPAQVPSAINLFDKNTVTKGVYVRWDTGTLVNSEGYNASDFIPFDPRLKYMGIGTTEQLAFYASDKTWVGGLIGLRRLNTDPIPETARFMRITALDSQLNDVNVFVTNPITQYDLNSSVLGYIKSQISSDDSNTTYNYLVAKSGGDFTTIREAIEKTKTESSLTIKIGVGTWKLEDEYTQEELESTSFKGWVLQNNVTLVGSGKHNTILSGNLPAETTADSVTRISTIHLSGSANLKNMTIIGSNVRYAVHNDERGVLRSNFENCILHKKNAGRYCQALGGGTYSGAIHKHKDCVFITDFTGSSDIPVSYHSNVNYDEPSYIEFENCRTQCVSTYKIRFGSLPSNQKNQVKLVGNKFPSVYVFEEGASAVGKGFDFEFIGYGNQPMTFNLKSQENISNIPADFIEDVTFKVVT